MSTSPASTTSPPALPPGHEPRAALFWLGFHLRRNLRKRAFALWAGGVALGLVGLLGLADAGADDAGVFAVLMVPPVLALFFGTGVMREEIEDQTLTYSFSRPVGRHWLYAARVLAALGPVALVSVPASFAAGATEAVATGLRFAAGAAVATVAYGGLFALAGQLIKWPTWFGLAFLLFWEGAVGRVPGFLGRLTLVTQVRAITGLRPFEGPLDLYWEPPPQAWAVVALLSVAVATLWLGGQLVRRREFVLTR